MAETYVRNTAYHVSIQAILNAPYERSEEQYEANYVFINGKKVSRVNIIATVINQEKQEKVIRTTIDDGTASIQIVSFEQDPKLAALEPGDVILVIGRIREYNGLKYLIPEIIKPLENHLWIEVRKKELEEQAQQEHHHYAPMTQEQPSSFVSEEESSQQDSLALSSQEETSMTVEEETILEEEMQDILTPQEEILRCIADLDQGDGADMQEVIEKINKPNTESLIEAMLREGEIYQIKPGKLKLL